jgi:hypothetical protein
MNTKPKKARNANKYKTQIQYNAQSHVNHSAKCLRIEQSNAKDNIFQNTNSSINGIIIGFFVNKDPLFDSFSILFSQVFSKLFHFCIFFLYLKT